MDRIQVKTQDNEFGYVEIADWNWFILGDKNEVVYVAINNDEGDTSIHSIRKDQLEYLRIL